MTSPGRFDHVVGAVEFITQNSNVDPLMISRATSEREWPGEEDVRGDVKTECHA
jgi:hypothetical protein